MFSILCFLEILMLHRILILVPICYVVVFSYLCVCVYVYVCICMYIFVKRLELILDWALYQVFVIIIIIIIYVGRSIIRTKKKLLMHVNTSFIQ